MSAVLDGFEPFSFGNTGPSVSITKNGVTFNKAAVEKIGKPQVVLLLINTQSKQFAIKKATTNDPNAVPFCVAAKKGAPSVRWNSKELLRTISSMTGWDLTLKSNKSYKVLAIHDKAESALIFDLASATETT